MISLTASSSPAPTRLNVADKLVSGRMRRRNPVPSIQVTEAGFAIVDVAPEPQLIAIDDVELVTFFKRDEITTDLICCEIAVSAPKGGQTWFLHEETPGWERLVKLLERLPGFDPDWRDKVSKPAFVENRTVAFRRAH